MSLGRISWAWVGVGILSLALGALAAEVTDRVAADKEALAALQPYVGQWKGVGQPKRGSTQGSWIEQSDWAWQFGKGRASIGFASPQGKYFAAGSIRPADKSGQFEFLGTLPDGKTQQRFLGQVNEEGRLEFQAVDRIDGQPTHLSLRQVAGGDRLLMLLEMQSAGGGSLLRLAEVGYTRQGSNFGQGNTGPECVVTGGYGSIAVSYKGQTYYVCCTGCRDLFNDDPEGILAEYRARKQKEKEKKKS